MSDKDQTQVSTATDAGDAGYNKALKNRHIQMIAIGGSIGTGLFLGAGGRLAQGGPVLALSYAVCGVFAFLMVRALGELAVRRPSSGAFVSYAREFLGEKGAFITGWFFFLDWAVTVMADITAVAVYMHYWNMFKVVPQWVIALIALGLVFVLNMMSVKAFGEAEFWFALIKFVASISLVIVGFGMVAMGTVDEEGTAAAVSNLWSHGGFFPTGFTGFLGGFQIALFAFIGIEMVGTTVAETDDPDNTLPKAVNSIPVRIMLFYVAALAAIMMVTPWDQVSPERSPFFTMFSLTGLGAAATIVNLVVLSSAASSANSGIYSTSRMLYGLARQEQAPGVFARLSKHHVPLNALFLSCVCLLSGIVIMGMGGSISAAFTLVTSVSATLFMGVWVVIVVSYLVYLRRRPELHKVSRFKSPGGALGAWVVLAFMGCMGVILAMWDDTRPGLVYSLVWIAFIVGAAFANRHYLLRRASRGVLGDGGTGEGPHQGPHLHE